MKRTLSVFLGDTPRRIGTIRFDSQGARQSAAFEYDRDWLAAPDRFALGPDLRLLTGPQFHKPRTRDASIFHGAIADTEPDGWARRVILRDHAKRRATNRAAGGLQNPEILGPIDFLLAVDDTNRVGALRFQDEEGAFQRSPEEGQRTAPPLMELSMLMAASRAVDSIRRHGADAQADIDELWRRIAFSILINNVDDHLHNHGFLHVTNGQWRLSPAFDINPFPDRLRELKTWISEDAGPTASIEALMAVAPYFKVGNRHAVEILAAVERTVSTWRVRGRDLGMTPNELDQYADAFEHHERVVAQTVLRQSSG